MTLPAIKPAAPAHRPAPDPAGIEAAARLLNSADRPLILLGGGTVGDPTSARQLVEKLDAPTLTTVNARGVLGTDHTLDLGTTGSFPAIRAHVAEADVILAVGTELGETDYDMVFDGGFVLTGRLIRIDLDGQQLHRVHPATVGLTSDAGLALRALVKHIDKADRNGATIAHGLRHKLSLLEQTDIVPFVSLFDALDRLLPEAILVGDSTQTVYAGNFIARRSQPRRWFNACTGYGTLGYALPAAIGANLACPDSPVVALVGDGGLMFTLSELATARELARPIIVILWNNAGYEEIRQSMYRADVPACGVDLSPPDFQAISAGFDCGWHRVENANELSAAIALAGDDSRPTIVEIDAERWLVEHHH